MRQLHADHWRHFKGGGGGKVRFRLSQHPPEPIAIAQEHSKPEGDKSTHFLKASLRSFPKG